MIDTLKKLQHRLADQRGASTVEYAIVVCLVAAVGVGVWQQFGSNIKDYTTDADEKIAGEMEKE
jgi:Flp pilus assembly pilin Flp